MTNLTSTQTWRRDPQPEGRQLGTGSTRPSVKTFAAHRVPRWTLRDRGRSLHCSALGITRDAQAKARSKRRQQTYRTACIVARTAGVAVEKVLTGMWPGDRCPHCGGTGKRSQIVGG